MEANEYAAGVTGPVWYQDAYFCAHLADEIAACHDRSRESYVVYLSLGGCSRTAARMLFNCVRDEMREGDFAGMLADGDYAICLSATSLRRACALARYLTQQLAGFDAAVGLAGLGIDGQTPDEVLTTARLQCIEDRSALEFRRLGGGAIAGLLALAAA